MSMFLDNATRLVSAALELEGRAREAKLKEAVLALEGVAPSSERDGLMAISYLRLHQYYSGLPKPPTAETERSLTLGYSYARTSKQEQVQRLANKLLSQREQP